ncbi:hypothetical protein [Oscillibacter sp.]|uniref:hypothetical protein n=1 Tax=Oscillibacter sp. TaxID=1945593 RepID=UPI00339B95FD
MVSGTQNFRVAMLLRSDAERVKQIIGDKYLGCQFDYFRIDRLDDLKEKFLQIKNSYDGILTSGTLSDRFIGYYGEGVALPHRYFSATVENYYRMILLQTIHCPNLDLSKVRLDLMTREHDLPDIIEANRLGALMREERAVINRMSPEEVISYEQEMIERHVRAIRSREYQFFMTRSMIATEVFQKYGIGHIYVRLTPEEIFGIVEALRREMELKSLKDSQVACIYFNLGEGVGDKDRKKVETALNCFNASLGSKSLLLNETVDGNFEAFTDAQTIYDLTRENTYCELTGLLKRQSGISAAVGYGIGSTIQCARENAATAVKYAGSTACSAGQTFLIGSDGRIKALRTDMEPDSVSRRERDGIFEPTINEIASQAHLSSTTVFKLMLALQRGQYREVDSNWIKQELNVSLRMANKILSNLEKAGYAEISGKYLLQGKGRPNNIYRFRFEV